MFPVSIVLDGTELTPLQQRTMFKLVGYSSPPLADRVLAADAVFGIWIYMLIQRLKFLEPEQRAFLAEQCIPDLACLGDKLADPRPYHLRSQNPILVIADGRYAAWYQSDGWLDLRNGDRIASGPDPLETVGFNLNTMFSRNRAACHLIQQRRAKNAADSTPPKSESTLS